MISDPDWLRSGGRDLRTHENPCLDGLEVVIPFTTVASVRRSIRHAEGLCSDLDASIRIVRPVAVPYPLDLEMPLVGHPALLAQLNLLNSSLPLRADIRLCRDWKQGLLSAIDPSVLVVLSCERHLLRTEEEKIARFLRQAGYEVSLFLEEHSHA